jgi:hypothetical protein
MVARGEAEALDQVVADAHGGIGRILARTHELRPFLVDRANGARPVDDRHARRQRRDDRGFHLLAGGERLLGLLPQQRVGEDIGDEAQGGDERLLPEARRAAPEAERAQHAMFGHQRQDEH